MANSEMRAVSLPASARYGCSKHWVWGSGGVAQSYWMGRLGPAGLLSLNQLLPESSVQGALPRALGTHLCGAEA